MQGKRLNELPDIKPVCDKVRPRWWQDTGPRRFTAEALLCALKENA